MSASLATAAEPGHAPGGDTGFRRHRGTAGLVLLVLVAALVLMLTDRSSGYPSAPLHPENPEPGGARAVAQVLDDQGVDVEVAHDQDELRGAEVDGDTTLMVTGTEFLSPSTTETLRSEARAAGDVVLVGPGQSVLDDYGLDVEVSSVDGGRLEAGCDDALLSGMEVDVDASSAYAPRTSHRDGCFAAEGAGSAEQAWLVLRTGRNGPLLLGAPALLRNDDITRADAAAVALRLLGGNDRLVWYHATLDDLPVHEQPADPLLPRWLAPMLVLLAGAALALIAWRGRRLGPLTVEPLPVQVLAVEATQSRGRLYRRVRDPEHAASALRDGTLARLSARLGLPHTAAVDAVVAVLSDRTGRPPSRLRELLADRAVPDDRALVVLAAELTDLEEELRVDGTEDGRR